MSLTQETSQSNLKDIIARNSWEIDVGGMTAIQLEEELKKRNIFIHKDAQLMMKSTQFTPDPVERKMQVVILTPLDLGITNFTRLEEIYLKAKSLNLALCPPDTAQHSLLNHHQPYGSGYDIAMDPITDFEKNRQPHIFSISSIEGKHSLTSVPGHPTVDYLPRARFLFQIPANWELPPNPTGGGGI